MPSPAGLLYTLHMRWRRKEVLLRGRPQVFTHVAVQLVLLDTRTARPQRTKLVDKFMEPAVARVFLQTLRDGVQAQGLPMTEQGDFFLTSAP